MHDIFEQVYVGNRDTDTHRVCGCCGQLKPVDQFYRDGKDRHGNVRYRRDCKDCYKKARILEEANKHD